MNQNGLEWVNLTQVTVIYTTIGKLEVVKKEMERVNINILGISELKWTGLGELLDLIDRVPEELWTEVCDIVQETGSKTIPKKRNAKKQNGCLRMPYK